VGAPDRPALDRPPAGRLRLPLELVATVVAFLARDTFGATGVGLFTTSWLALGIGLMQSPPGSRSNAVGLFLLAFAAAALLAAAAVMAKPFFTVLIGLGATRAALSGVWEIWGSTRADQIGGVIAAALCVLGLYGGIALLLEDAKQRAVLPLGRIGDARRALEGDLGEQLQRVTRKRPASASSSEAATLRRWLRPSPGETSWSSASTHSPTAGTASRG
jgi:hypothetical protein